MRDKKDLSRMLKYYMVWIAISFVPVLVANVLLDGLVSPAVLWIVSAVVMMIFVVIGMLYRPTHDKKVEDKKRDHYDPFK